MLNLYKTCLWRNFAAVIDMLANEIKICPEELWKSDKKIFYMAYHVVIFLDYYLSNPVSAFNPALKYTIVAQESMPKDAIDDVIPNEFYSKQDFANYISLIRERCRKEILSCTDESLNQRWIKDNEIDLHGLCPSLVINYSRLEIFFYNLRHVQHHVGQLNLMLRQKANLAADWISLADSRETEEH